MLKIRKVHYIVRGLQKLSTNDLDVVEVKPTELFNFYKNTTNFSLSSFSVEKLDFPFAYMNIEEEDFPKHLELNKYSFASSTRMLEKQLDLLETFKPIDDYFLIFNGGDPTGFVYGNIFNPELETLLKLTT